MSIRKNNIKTIGDQTPIPEMLRGMVDGSDSEDSDDEEVPMQKSAGPILRNLPMPKIAKTKSLLNILDFRRDQFMELKETIDTDKLNFIVSNRAIFEPLLREDKRFENIDSYDPFLMAQKYLEKSRNGEVSVAYKQKKNVGRYYANKSMSLQCITRQIRQTIAEGYIDIDIKNCHPNILKFVCDNLGISCPILSKYCDNRDKFFKDNGISKSIGKIAFLSVMNGGSSAYKKLENPSIDLHKFYSDEIINIHDSIAFKYADEFKNHRDKRVARDITYNHRASFMNIILCDIENKILQVMHESFGSNSHAVLCFDGIMLPKSGEYDLKACERAIFEKLKIAIQLDIKPFEDAFDMSIYKIPKYEEIQLNYYPDFRNLVCKDVYPEVVDEWCRNTLVLIENGGKGYFLTKNRTIDSMTHEERVCYRAIKEEDIMRNLFAECNILNPSFDHLYSEQYYALKPAARKEFMRTIDADDLVKIGKYNFHWLGANVKSEPGYLQEAKVKRKLVSHNGVEFLPFLARNGEPTLYDSFNMFTGFPMERVVITKKIDFTKSRLYKHLKEELMDNNEGEFNHFLDHVADMIQDPARIKTNGHLFYTKQGMGKGCLAEFTARLLGTDHAISFENTDAYFGQFNADQCNKILKIFEEVSDKGVAFANHDRLKGDQSKSHERVEPKGIDPYKIRHCARFWYFTNNEGALYIEGGDRRFTCHKANNRYANDTEYFTGIWEEVRDIQFCRNAFEFFATRKYTSKSVFNPYDTKFKRDQKQLNLPNGLKFMKELVENDYNSVGKEGDKVKAKSLAVAFKGWCEDTGVRFSLGTFKTQLRKLDLNDRSLRYDGAKAKCYTLTTEDLKNRFKEYLKDDTFEFDMVATTEEERNEIREAQMIGE